MDKLNQQDMKRSKVVLVLIVITISLFLYKFVRSDTMSIDERFGNNVGAIYSVEAAKQHAEYLKERDIKNIIIQFSLAIIALLLIYIFLKKRELKFSALGNLKNLKSKNIFSNEEYTSKIKKLEEQENLRKVMMKKSVQFEQLKEDLENLRSKDLLTEEEFQSKLDLLKTLHN